MSNCAISRTKECACFVPPSENFRAWVAGSLAALELSGRALSSGAGVNSDQVNAFLRGATRDVRLGTAHAVADYLKAQASRRGVSLPHMSGGVHV